MYLRGKAILRNELRGGSRALTLSCTGPRMGVAGLRHGKYFTHFEIDW